jgi:hypothetical protein
MATAEVVKDFIWLAIRVKEMKPNESRLLVVRHFPVIQKSLTEEKFFAVLYFFQKKWKNHRLQPPRPQQVKAALTLFMTHLGTSSLLCKICSSPTLPLKSC